MPETTYERYKRVLQEIADGAADPMRLAADALKSPKPPPSYAWKHAQEARAAATQTRRNKRTANAKVLYQDWMAAGRPPIATHARALGFARSTLLRLLKRAEKDIPKGQRRLDWWIHSRDFRTVDELDPD